MDITFISGWLKIGVRVDDVPVGVVITDIHEFRVLEGWDMLTDQEKSEVKIALLSKWPTLKDVP